MNYKYILIFLILIVDIMLFESYQLYQSNQISERVMLVENIDQQPYNQFLDSKDDMLLTYNYQNQQVVGFYLPNELTLYQNDYEEELNIEEIKEIDQDYYYQLVEENFSVEIDDYITYDNNEYSSNLSNKEKELYQSTKDQINYAKEIVYDNPSEYYQIEPQIWIDIEKALYGETDQLVTDKKTIQISDDLNKEADQSIFYNVFFEVYDVDLTEVETEVVYDYYSYQEEVEYNYYFNQTELEIIIDKMNQNIDIDIQVPSE